MRSVRDVRDWNKYVDMVGKTVSKHAVPVRLGPTTSHTAGDSPEQDAAPIPEAAVSGHSSAAISQERFLPPRKGRGPRKEETREELLSRLLDPTLTLEETARILEVCPTTVRRYTNKGILPHERSQGNQRRFKLSSVIAFREAQLRSESDDEGSR
jgi:excisionase family DNA binding protein